MICAWRVSIQANSLIGSSQPKIATVFIKQSENYILGFLTLEHHKYFMPGIGIFCVCNYNFFWIISRNNV